MYFQMNRKILQMKWRRLSQTAWRQTALTNLCLCWFSFQELKGKILLKAKKISGPEDCLDETLTDEVSDDEEMANDDAEILSIDDQPAECLNHTGKVHELYDFSVRALHLFLNQEALFLLAWFDHASQVYTFSL